ncbi:hypothetical protein C0966_05485 [Bacillus methanolicus]|uniref:hypothetical protein n=1 Tax=Bacillus methanolicus TaxID=1471 RepID=UPI0023809165|nr:hypothetical protein [Bacillus methanolicus]MDE3838832.1 hypothetical protein [Bacillus methanolicus]
MIKRLELKKIITSPIVITLLILFTAFNIFIIYQHAPMREDMSRINRIIDDNGTLMDEKGRKNLKNSYEKELASWNRLAEKKTGKTYESASEFFEPENYYPAIESGVFTEAELERIVDLMVKESYLLTAEDIVKQYENMDLLEAAEAQIKMYGLSGEAAETVREQYKSLEPRLEEIKKNKEHLHLFFLGKMFETHSFLFKTLFRYIIFQAMLLVVLFTAFLVNYEYDQHTYLLTYSTKRGRKLMWDKLAASLFASVMVTAFLLFGTFVVYFLVFDYSRLWKVPISTGFLIEPNNAPFISWWNFTFIEYFLLGCLLLLICQILFTLITFVLSMWIRNSYVVFIIFGVLLGAGILLPGKMPLDSNTIFYAHFTPFVLMLGSKKWWMESGAFTTFQYYELITLGIWLPLFMLTTFLCIKRFYHQNL